jgi:hypothetical protein
VIRHAQQAFLPTLTIKKRAPEHVEVRVLKSCGGRI